MSRIKIEDKFVYMEFGFPVILLKVPMIKIRGNWTPNINLNELMREVLFRLANKRSFLTGNQIRFIRQYFNMTFKQFGTRFDVSRTTVIKWENCKNLCSSMRWSIEKDIRLFVLDKMNSTSRKLKELYRSLKDKNAINSEENLLELNFEEITV